MTTLAEALRDCARVQRSFCDDVEHVADQLESGEIEESAIEPILVNMNALTIAAMVTVAREHAESSA